MRRLSARIDSSEVAPYGRRTWTAGPPPTGDVPTTAALASPRPASTGGTGAGSRIAPRGRREECGAADRADGTALYLRFASPLRNERGHFTGVFGLVNRLAREGRLSAAEESFRRAGNRWYDAAYPDPSSVDPAVYDAVKNPGAAAWFKPSAHHLIERVGGYPAILAAHAVPCRPLRCADPGRIVYEDDVQIVVVPYGVSSRRPCEVGGGCPARGRSGAP